MVTIWFRNREGYVRFAIHISVNYHTRTLPFQLGDNVNVTILVCPMISRTSVVIPQKVSYKRFLIMLMVNGHTPTLTGSL